MPCWCTTRSTFWDCYDRLFQRKVYLRKWKHNAFKVTPLWLKRPFTSCLPEDIRPSPQEVQGRIPELPLSKPMLPMTLTPLSFIFIVVIPGMDCTVRWIPPHSITLHGNLLWLSSCNFQNLLVLMTALSAQNRDLRIANPPWHRAAPLLLKHLPLFINQELFV